MGSGSSGHSTEDRVYDLGERGGCAQDTGECRLCEVESVGSFSRRSYRKKEDGIGQTLAQMGPSIGEQRGLRKELNFL